MFHWTLVDPFVIPSEPATSAEPKRFVPRFSKKFRASSGEKTRSWFVNRIHWASSLGPLFCEIQGSQNVSKHSKFAWTSKLLDMKIGSFLASKARTNGLLESFWNQRNYHRMSLNDTFQLYTSSSHFLT